MFFPLQKHLLHPRVLSALSHTVNYGILNAFMGGSGEFAYTAERVLQKFLTHEILLPEVK